MGYISKISRLPSWMVILSLFTSFIISYNNFSLGLFLGIFILIWYFSIAFELNLKVPFDVKLSIKWFLFIIIYPYFYGIFAHFYFGSENTSSAVAGLVVPFHIFAMFCIFYSFYFISKCLVSIEDGKSPRFDRLIGSILMLWFLPIGIWFILPRIKRALS